MLVNKQELQLSLEQVESPAILVIGDLMLDRHTFGSVSRISPEAPIPILQVQLEENRLGGAANAMRNLATLGARVVACGVVGRDREAQVMQELFAARQIATQGVRQQEDLTTILKHRMIAGHHHLLRMDYDPPPEWELACEPAILEFLKESIPRVELVLISDYGKGLLTDRVLDTIREQTIQHAVPTIVDPRQMADYQIYRDFTLIKPNRKEIESLLQRPLQNKEQALEAAEQIQRDYHFQYVTISLDRDGLLLFQSPGNYTHFASEAQDVFDVVGAGDMVVSVMAFLMAGKAPIEHAAHWANLAAGMSIMHVGVVSFNKADLLQQLESK